MPYRCKMCGNPVEQSIEGELICERCWNRRQMTDEERQQEAEMEEYLSRRDEQEW